MQVQGQCSGGGNQNGNVLDLDYLTLTLYYTAPPTTTTTGLCASGSDILPSLSGTNPSALAGAPLLLSTVAGLLARRNRSRAVAPVVATILLIAVAVAISVIAFFWNQGFLSSTSSSTGSQQAAQNQAAQSSVSIEIATFKTGATTSNAVNTPTITIIIRNVGAVGVTPGSVTVTGSSSNSGFTGALTLGTLTTCPASGTATSVTSADGSWSYTLSTTTNIVGKGASTVLVLTQATASATMPKTQILSGDIINIRVTTSVGTFAQAQFTVP